MMHPSVLICTVSDLHDGTEQEEHGVAGQQDPVAQPDAGEVSGGAPGRAPVREEEKTASEGEVENAEGKTEFGCRALCMVG